MSEIDLREIPESSWTDKLSEGLRGLRSGEVLTAMLEAEGEPDGLIQRARGKTNRWDFQKHRQGDGSWLIHAKLSR